MLGLLRIASCSGLQIAVAFIGPVAFTLYISQSLQEIVSTTRGPRTNGPFCGSVVGLTTLKASKIVDLAGCKRGSTVYSYSGS